MIFNTTGKEQFLMTDSEIIYRYIHAGKGEVTLVNPSTGKAHQYAFLTPANKRDFPEDTIFVYVLHEGHRMYLGMLAGPEFRLTSRSRFSEETEAVKGARYIVKMANRQDLVNKHMMNLYHSGKCCICGRRLNSTIGLSEGAGRKCLKYYNSSLSKVPWDGN